MQKTSVTLNSTSSPSTFPRLSAELPRPEDFPSALAEQHPRLVLKAESLWGTPALLQFLDSLLISDRPNRQGFDEKCVKDIFLLRDIAIAKKNEGDAFDSAICEVADYELTERKKTRLSNLPEKGTSQAVCQRPLKWPYSPTSSPSMWIKENSKIGKQRFGDLFRERGLLTEEEIETSILLHDGLVGEKMVKSRLITNETVFFALLLQNGIPYVDLDSCPVTPLLAKTIPHGFALEHYVVPVEMLDGALYVACVNPMEFSLSDEIAFWTDLRIVPVAADIEQIRFALMNYGKTKQTIEAEKNKPEPKRKGDSETEAVSIVEKSLITALSNGASDIHFEANPKRNDAEVRARIDGLMRSILAYPVSIHSSVISRLKVMANLDISEKRKGQDGKMFHTFSDGNKREMRIATLPTIEGMENAVLRVLPNKAPPDISTLGISPNILTNMKRCLSRPHGLFIVCGPTGSGKTSTLHALLSEMATPTRKIWTAEDPVEYVQPKICQVQVNPSNGWGFSDALRSFMRADPDVIMIGEARDAETAKAAVEAALTGHLVLTTLHTNGAAETVSRLVELGIDPFLLSDALIGVLAQRLLLKSCPSCSSTLDLSQKSIDEVRDLALGAMGRNNSAQARMGADQLLLPDGGGMNFKVSAGCPECSGSGGKGRLAVAELLVNSKQISHLIRNRASADEIRKSAIMDGLIPLRLDALRKAVDGTVSLDEARSVF